MKLKTQILHLKKALFQIAKFTKQKTTQLNFCFNILKHNLRKIKLLGQMYTDTAKNGTDFRAAKSRIKGKFIVLHIIFPWKSRARTTPSSSYFRKGRRQQRPAADTDTPVRRRASLRPRKPRQVPAAPLARGRAGTGLAAAAAPAPLGPRAPPPGGRT